MGVEEIDLDAGAAFSLGKVPAIAFGAGERRRIAEHAAAIAGSGPSPSTAILVIDAALREMGIGAPVAGALREAGMNVAVFDEISGDPKVDQVDAAAEAVRSSRAGLVVGLGGGSALDVAKIAASIAVGEPGVMHYACERNPLPARPLPKICLPTTAGTGSEASRTNIFSGPDGRKLWIWNEVTKPDLIILDPELTTSLPPHLTAWTGLDALTHALEACTNKHRHPVNDIYCHTALQLISGALPAAVADGDDLDARAKMILGAAYAGIGIDNCGTAIAHNISHALAGLAPVHHGLASALGLEATLAWSIAADDGAFGRAARACGLDDVKAFAPWLSRLMDDCGVARKLPGTFRAFDAAALAGEMTHPANAMMLTATARSASDDDIAGFATRIIGLAQ